jgi:hypothetical protein
MSIWIKPAHNHCYEIFPAKAAKNCSIVLFKDSFMLYFDGPNSARVYFYAMENYYEISSP